MAREIGAYSYVESPSGRHAGVGLVFDKALRAVLFPPTPWADLAKDMADCFCPCFTPQFWR